MSGSGMRTLWGLVALGVLGLAAARAEAQDGALRDRVEQLVGRLASDDPGVRQAAEKALVDLGPRVLTVLPEPEQAGDADTRARLARVRQALESAPPLRLGEASRVTIQAKGMRLSEALQALQKQTGNAVSDLRETMNDAAPENPAIDLDLHDATFYEALAAISTAARLTPYFYTDDGSVGLMAAVAIPDGAAGATPVAMAGPDPRVALSGPFRVELHEIVVKREFSTGQHAANVRLELAWEPRLRPMLLSLGSAGVQVRDDQGRPVAPSLSDEAMSVPLRTTSPIAELNLNLAAPERSARALSSLKVEGRLTLPAGVRTFRFADLAHPEDKQQGDVTVSLVSTTVEDFAWKVRVLVGVPGQVRELDSYQQSLMNNRVWLQRADGSRFEQNGGYSDLGAAEGKVGFEYVFVDAPGKPSDYSLVYETPSEVTTVPVAFEFKDVPLP